MSNLDDTLVRLQEDPLVNVAIGVAVGLAFISLFSDKDKQKVNVNSKKIEELEARLAEL